MQSRYDHGAFYLFRSESEQTETAGADTTRSLGRTTLLRDTMIREAGGAKESPKTAVLLALSRPSRPITRSQSQVTVAGEVARKEQVDVEEIRLNCINDPTVAIQS